jgi:predicted transcriptional regulator
MVYNDCEEVKKMKVNRQKLELAMARACMNSADLPEAAQLPRATVYNAITGKGIRPGTLGKIAKALGVDPLEIIETEE